jgi:hypothetical protein
MLADLRQIAAGFGMGHADAPVEVVRRAAEIPLPNQIMRLRLLRTSLAEAGVRRKTAENFQCVFEGDGFQVRTMYSKTANKWHVMAVVAPQVDALEVGGRRIKPANGKFEFEVNSLDATGFTLIVAGTRIAVPSGSDKSSDG